MNDIIKFLNSDLLYEVQLLRLDDNLMKMTFIHDDIPDASILNSGFYVMSSNLLICGNFSEYKYIIDRIDRDSLLNNQIIFTKHIDT